MCTVKCKWKIHEFILFNNITQNSNGFQRTISGQELLSLPEHVSSPPVFSVRVAQSLVLFVCFVDNPFVLFLFAIVLFVILRFMDYDYLPLVSSNSSQ